MQRKQQPRRRLGQKPLKVLLQLASDNSVALPQVAIKKVSIFWISKSTIWIWSLQRHEIR
jgi:hypothetical protein